MAIHVHDEIVHEDEEDSSSEKKTDWFILRDEKC
jgi:hypothetical protein